MIKREHLHTDFYLDKGDIVHVEIDHQANIMLLDEKGYQNYRSGGGFQYIGGNYKISPINISAPASGHWYLVIDLGGYAGSIRHSVKVIKQ